MKTFKQYLESVDSFIATHSKLDCDEDDEFCFHNSLASKLVGSRGGKSLIDTGVKITQHPVYGAALQTINRADAILSASDYSHQGDTSQPGGNTTSTYSCKDGSTADVTHNGSGIQHVTIWYPKDDDKDHDDDDDDELEDGGSEDGDDD